MMTEGLESGNIKLRGGDEVVTFQDPCRLSKGASIIESPRSALRHTGTIKEMPRSGAVSACCGTSGWVDCDHTAKKVQMERLKEAASTGAEALITACPKCLIHLSCADRHHGSGMARRVRIEDLHVRAARHLERREGGHRAKGQ
jgi:Fe-S oxidoreductase